jgi:tetratricopeptide (TPR) repeat protein
MFTKKKTNSDKDPKKDEKVADKADAKEGEAASNGEKPKIQPLSPAKRKRLQQCFERGSMLSGKGDYDYANTMFVQCVANDPGNLIYTQNLLLNLIKKYNNNKKGARGAGLRGAGAKANVKKAQMKKDWQGVIKAGLEVLPLNPWDTQTLTDMAKACEAMELDECQIAYLKTALDANPKDIGLNRLAANAFAQTARFDEAIRCLQRIIQQRPNDQDLVREVNQMTVNKTIHKGGYEEAETSLDVSVEKKAKDLRAGGTIELTEEQQLRRDIKRHSEEVLNYSALKDYYFKKEDFAAAEAVMEEAVEATGAVRAREELEDVQIHRAQLEVMRAKKRAESKKTDEAVSLYKRMKDELNKKELAVYIKRCERYPGDYALRYELGMRLKRIGKFQEAIEHFQQARNEAKKKASAALEAGECFQQIKQYQLAINSYKESVAMSGVFDEEIKKLALYRAGWLCKGLKDYDSAEQLLQQLAGMEYGYKDVAKLLDELVELKAAGS